MQRRVPRRSQVRLCIGLVALRPWVHHVSRRVRASGPGPQSRSPLKGPCFPNIQRRYVSHALHANDTIYALSTASGRAAIAVIRISGSACLAIYQQLCPNRPLPSPRAATLRQLLSPSDNTVVLDTSSLVLYFAGPKTVTGEDVLEFHVHGGPAIVRSVLQAIAHCSTTTGATIRAADPGEFTRRAFYRGRIDLTQVEALGETLAAETEQQRRLAMNSATSGLAQRYQDWRKMLLYARGELEALIDFSEDQHFDESPAEFMRSVSSQVLRLKRRIELHLKNATRGELLRSGIEVALLGPPNAGKSSLLNRIVGREAAIVSAEQGTTRDIVDVTVDIRGWLVKLGDMAGLRAGITTPDQALDSPPIGAIEQEGIRRARERALRSDLVIVLTSLRTSALGQLELDVNDELLDAVHECQRAGKHMLFVMNKIDKLHAQNSPSKRSLSSLLSDLVTMFPTTSPQDVFCISCKNADLHDETATDPGGLHNFLSGLQQKFHHMTSVSVSTNMDDVSNAQMTVRDAQNYWSASLSITHRQTQYLQQCIHHLDNFLEVGGAADPMMSPSPNAYHVDGHEDIIAETKQAEYEPVANGFFNTKSTSSTSAHLETHATYANQHTDSAIQLDSEGVDIVTAAEHLRYAADCLAKLTGHIDGTTSGADVEDILGVVFEK